MNVDLLWKKMFQLIKGSLVFIPISISAQSISVISPYENQQLNPGDILEIQWVTHGYTEKLMIGYSVSSETFDIFKVNAVEGSAYWIVPPITGDDVHIIIQLQSSPYTLITIPIVVASNIQKSNPPISEKPKTTTPKTANKRKTTTTNFKLDLEQNGRILNLYWYKNLSRNIEFGVYYQEGSGSWKLLSKVYGTAYSWKVPNNLIGKKIFIGIRDEATDETIVKSITMMKSDSNQQDQVVANWFYCILFLYLISVL